ncbi:helix-turn-helix domain-containing protein [Amycolatopsis sp. NPDC059657]|uniref:helix-turn-helix domain-containing protein n=1 Tax=Amycolatopsis sp. NPDC059657 TaxID=3346899 RepID=UPI00367358DB
MFTELARPARLLWRRLATPQEPADVKPVLLTITEVCAMLRISRWSVYQLINSRRLASVQIGRRRLVELSAIRAMLRAESETA